MNKLNDEASVEEVDNFIDNLIEETEYHYKKLKIKKTEDYYCKKVKISEDLYFSLRDDLDDSVVSISITRNPETTSKYHNYMSISSIEVNEDLFFTDNKEVVDFVYNKLKGFWK